MALQKQSVQINFQQGIEQKIDKFQLPVGKFEVLVNSTFDKIGRLTKRDGFGSLPALPDTDSSFVTTFNGALTAVGSGLRILSEPNSAWISRGLIDPLRLSTQSLVKNNTNQIWADSAISPNGLVCTVYTDFTVGAVGSTFVNTYKYTVTDQETGQVVVSPTQLTSGLGNVQPNPRVWTLGNNFIVMYPVGSNTSGWLQYFALNSYSLNVGSFTTFTSKYVGESSMGGVSSLSASSSSFDGVVANNTLYVSYPGVNITGSNSSLYTGYLNTFLTAVVDNVVGSANAPGPIALGLTSVTADITASSPVIWTSFFQVGQGLVYSKLMATNQVGNLLFPIKTFQGDTALNNISLTAQGGFAELVFEYNLQIGTSGGYSSNILALARAPQSTGSVSFISPSGSGNYVGDGGLLRGAQLASKGYLMGSTSYYGVKYVSANQTTYFTINSSGQTVSKYAYGNAYPNLLPSRWLPQVTVVGSSASNAYIVREDIQAVNKDTNVAAGTQTAGVYSQFGVNLITLEYGTSKLSSTEIGKNLNINGGFLWAYDGGQAVEQGFHLYPDNVQVSNTTVGSLSNQTYYYQATYEWSDNQGNLFRSAPSVPVSVVSSGTLSSNTINVPTLKLTHKIDNPVKIVIYRWSTAQQVYYQTTSIDTPILNDPSIDLISFVDRNSDAAILGNNIIYTNGGVLENIGGPACNALTVFDSRLWMISAENPNLLLFSKPVLPNVPVEMSDLQSVYVSPTNATQGFIGEATALGSMDDKLIIFFKNAIYYLNGTGPDSTGANSGYSQPTFIAGTVGSDNQRSIVLTPNGLMFKSDKGIWMLGRDLSTTYIGKDVEDFNQYEVTSAVTVPGTNQVRFTLSNGQILMYDYLVGQWGSFEGVQGLSSTLYEKKHTLIDGYGRAFQETPGQYLDGSNPVLMNFRTGWLSLAGLQGYQRLYDIYMLGEYKTPHRLTVGLAYDYDSAVTQLASIIPTNYAGVWGSSSSWGSVTYWGGNSRREQWEINPRRQQCQSFQISFNEYFDSQYQTTPGAGLTVSGLNLVVGMKSSSPKNIGRANRTG